VIDVGAVPAVLLDDAEHRGGRGMAGHAGRNARARDGVAVRIERDLLPIDGDDDAEYALGAGRDVLGGGLYLTRGFVARGQDRAVGLGRPADLVLLGQRKGSRGGDTGEQGGARRHGQEVLPLAEISGRARIGPLRVLHEGPPSGALRRETPVAPDWAQKISRAGGRKVRSPACPNFRLMARTRRESDRGNRRTGSPRLCLLAPAPRHP